MWKVFAASGALMVAAGTAPLRSEEMPWCVKMDVFTSNCAFTSYNECATVAAGAGTNCIRNPNYRPPAAASAHRKNTATKASNPQR